MSGNNLVVGARRCRGGHTTRPRIHSPPKGPLTKWHNHRKQKPPSSSSPPRSLSKEEYNSKTSVYVEHQFWVCPTVMTQRNMLSTCPTKIGAQFERAPKNSTVTVYLVRRLVPGGRGSPEICHWKPWNAQLATMWWVYNGGHLLRSRLDNGHTPTATTWGRGAQESVHRRDSLERSRLAVVEPRMAQASLRPQHATCVVRYRYTMEECHEENYWSFLWRGHVLCWGTNVT